jgi:hypothetical protein
MFLVNSGADISLIKRYKSLGTTEFEPKDRERVNSVEGSVIDNHGSIETQIRKERHIIPFVSRKWI